MKRAYEVFIVVRLDVDEATVNNTIEQTRNWIEADGLGQVKKADRWGRRKLAYEIDKQREGYYVLFTADIEPKAIDELERNLRLSPNLLRYLVIRQEE